MTEHSSLTQKIYDTLREEILDGKYPTGSAFTEEEMAQRFEASRSPVRTAFRYLKDDGLLQLIPNKGAVVEGITYKDMDDVYEIRMRIEGLASAYAAQNATEKDIEALTEIVDLSSFYLEHGKLDKLKNLDGRFHETIFQLADRKILHGVLSGLLVDVSRFRAASWQCSDRMRDALLEHREILKAIEEHDSQKAEELTRFHIQKAYENIKKIFSPQK
ncbi:MAG: GntR family transcriptional regulator [Clostridia bacterium]|nr:GntR family transcriptional regulator [Clostridia bacterium]